MHTNPISSSSSLLEMLQLNQRNKLSTAGSGEAAKTSTASLTPVDTVSIQNSDSTKMMDFIDQLQKLSVADPAKFKQAMADMSAQVRAAAAKSTDASEKAFLTSLADSFDASAQSGKLEPPKFAQDGASAGHAHGHHHGHHQAPPPSLSQLSTGTQDLMTSLFDEVSKTTGASSV